MLSAFRLASRLFIPLKVSPLMRHSSTNLNQLFSSARASFVTSLRTTRPQQRIDWVKIKIRARAMVLQNKKKLPRIRESALDRFRLTRFGWQHRHARLHARNRRNMPQYMKKRHRSIGYVHHRDFKTMKKYFPHMLLIPRSSPKDTNPNVLFARTLLPAHFG